MASKLFDKALKQSNKDSKIFVSRSLDIVDRIHEILERQGKTQKDLADALEKKESEISKWMSGLHNITLKTISKIESVLGEDIIMIPKKQLKVINKRKYVVPSKAQLIEAIASDASLTKADARRALDAFVGATTKSFRGGKRVALEGFGSFKISKRKARTGRNPKTGTTIQIPAKKVVRFKSGADLAKTVDKRLTKEFQPETSK